MKTLTFRLRFADKLFDKVVLRWPQIAAFETVNPELKVEAPLSTDTSSREKSDDLPSSPRFWSLLEPVIMTELLLLIIIIVVMTSSLGFHPMNLKLIDLFLVFAIFSLHSLTSRNIVIGN